MKGIFRFLFLVSILVGVFAFNTTKAEEYYTAGDFAPTYLGNVNSDNSGLWIPQGQSYISIFGSFKVSSWGNDGGQGGFTNICFYSREELPQFEAVLYNTDTNQLVGSYGISYGPHYREFPSQSGTNDCNYEDHLGTVGQPFEFKWNGPLGGPSGDFHIPTGSLAPGNYTVYLRGTQRTDECVGLNCQDSAVTFGYSYNVLGTSGSFRVEAGASPNPATITVHSNLNTSWDITGQEHRAGSGGSATYSVDAGQYNLWAADQNCYSTPSVSSTIDNASSGGATRTVGEDQTLHYEITYSTDGSCDPGEEDPTNTPTPTATATPAPGSPIVDIKFNGSDGPVTIAYNASGTLSWTVQDADSCTASNGWSGAKSHTGGSEGTGALTTSHTFTLTCTSPYGNTPDSYDSVTVNVQGLPPSCIEDADPQFAQALPAVLTPGQSYNFTTTVHNIGNTWWYHGSYFHFAQRTGMNLNPGYQNFTPSVHSGQTGDAGFILVAPSNPGNYTLTLQMVHRAGADYQLDDSTTCGSTPNQDVYFGQPLSVNFTVANPPTVNITADASDGPLSVDYGSYHNLTWTSTDATSCSLYGNNAFTGWTGTSQSNIPFGPATLSQYTFRVDCSGVGGTASDQVVMNTRPEPPGNPTVSCNLAGTSATISWTGGALSSSYHLRVNNTTNDTCEQGWYCADPPDRLLNFYTPTSYTTSVTPDTYYTWWVHGVNDAGYTDPTGGAFTCAAPLYNNSQFISQTVNGVSNPSTISVIPGQQFSAALVFKNTGTSTWTSASNFKLGSQNPQDNSTWNSGRVVLPNSVSPGQTVSIPFTATAPTTLGTYNFQWKILREGVEWFGEPSANVQIVAAPPTVTLQVDQTSLPWNNTGAVGTWSSTYATACVGSGSWSGPIATSGSGSTGHLEPGQYTYTLTCSNPGGSASASVVISVSPPTPSSGGAPTAVQPDYCSSGPAVTINWGYSDPSGSPQMAYQVQVTDTGNFNNPIFDSGKVTSSAGSYALGQGILTWNTTYKARVMVWNTYNSASAWSSPTSSWKTPQYAYPQANFTWSPSRPGKNTPIQFTDQTVFGGGNSNNRHWNWVFGDGATSSAHNPTHAYASESTFPVTMTATDAANQSCSIQKNITIQKPVPSIKEVAPK